MRSIYGSQAKNYINITIFIQNSPIFIALKHFCFFSRISDDIHESIPNLVELYLTNCELKELSDLNVLSNFKKLEYLSLLRNPVTHQQHYRFYVIYHIPQIRVLDFRRVKMKVCIIVCVK